MSVEAGGKGLLFREKNERRLFATAVLVYFLFQRAGGAGTRYLTLVYSIVRDKSFIIDKYLGIHNIDISFFKGHFYLAAQPGAPLLAAPFYAILRIPLSLFHPSAAAEQIIANLFLNFVVNILLIAYCGVLFYRIAKHFTSSDNEATAATVAFYFGSMIFSYATEFMVGDSLALFFCFAAFYILFTFRSKPSGLKALCAGCCMGLAISMSMVAAPVVGLLILFAIFSMKPKHLVITACGAALFAVLLMVYNRICFGGFFTSYGDYMYLSEFARYHEIGEMDYPKLHRLLNLTVMPIRGIFLYMPITILAVPAIVFYLLPKRNAGNEFRDSLNEKGIHTIIYVLVIAIFIIQLLLNSSHKTWSAGASWGPRYMLVSIPFLMLLAASFFRYIKPALIWFFLGISIIINTVGSMGIPLCRDLFGYFAGFFTLGWRPRLPAAHLLVAETGLFPQHLITGWFVFLVSCILGMIACVILYFIWRPEPKPRIAENAEMQD